MNDLGKFVGNGIKSIISYLRKIVEGFNETTQQYGGGGINEVNNKLEAVKTKLDTLDVSVKLDDPDIAEINQKVGGIQTAVTAQGTAVGNIYTLLDARLVEKQWITRADYDALVLAGEVDPEVLYIVIESQSNPSNP